MQIQWFPGHMAKARREVSASVKLVDIVIELVDARIPLSSRNPMINEILAGKPRIIVLNKADLADSQASHAWITRLEREHRSPIRAVAVDSIGGQGMSAVLKAARELTAATMEARKAKGLRPRAIRALVVGIPNVGKSSFINRLTGGRTARTGDKPGVTRGQQWVRINPELELLDTPGILWPKFDDPQAGIKLAATGAISDLVVDQEQLAAKTLELIRELRPSVLQNRYKLAEVPPDGFNLLELIGRRRGCLLHGGAIDTSKVATLVLKELRQGLLGKFTLDQLTEDQ